MSHIHSSTHTSWLTVAGRGAEIGVGLSFVYAIAFLAYAAIRSATRLLSTPAIDAGWMGTVLATWMALAVPAFVFAALLLPLVALLGALTALVVYAISPTLNPERAPRRAILIGVGVCSLVVLAILLLLGNGAGLRWTPALAETLTFWLGLPLVLYVAAGGVASWRLNQMQRKINASGVTCLA